MPAPPPANEEQRVAALRDYEVLDTPPDRALDDIVHLAAHICDTPYALITLIDANRQWFKARVGFTAGETERDIAFCAHAIATPDQPMVVPDALADERFAANPLVTGETAIRFYYGLPLVNPEGHALGTLCVMDRQPRTLTQEQETALRALQRSVIAELELRRNAVALRKGSTAVRHDSESRFRALLETTSDAVLMFGASGHIRYANSAVRTVFGHEPGELLGRDMAMLQPERFREGHRKGIERYLATGEKRVNWRAALAFGLHRDGHEFPVEISFSAPMLDGEQFFVGCVRDITERRRTEERVERLSRVYAVLGRINALIVRTRSRGELFEESCRIAVEQGGFGAACLELVDPVSLASRAVAWAGKDADRLQGGSLLAGSRGSAVGTARAEVINDLLAATHDAGPRCRVAIEQGYRSTIVLPIVVEGRVAAILSLFARQPDVFNAEELTLLSELAGDISFALEGIGKEEKLDYLAYHDVLTGLPNRTLLHERLTQLVQRPAADGARVALIALDVKGFRNVNESLGRHAGDALLVEFSRRLKAHWPGREGLARLASDHFAGVLVGLKDVAEVAQFLEHVLLPALDAPFALGEGGLSVAAFAGVAVFPADGSNAEELLNHAEAALKKAKRSGGRYLFYQPEMNAKVAEDLILESRLRRALEKGQFILHYQPKVDLRTGRMSGLEALIRWNDPASGLVAPGVFIPVMEESGMVNEVGLWVMRRALADFAALTARGLQPPRIAVNVSAVQLASADFVDEVRSLVSGATGGAQALEIEITESMLLEDLGSSIARLREIGDMGVRVTIDDFGTGHSSLVYLAKLPVHALKIDGSFVEHLPSVKQSVTIVSSIVSLAHSLGLTVVAEGVETREQLEVLRGLGCDEYQGFVFSRALPLEEIAALLQEPASAK